MPDTVKRVGALVSVLSLLVVVFLFLCNWNREQDSAIACKIDRTTYRADVSELNRQMELDKQEILSAIKNLDGRVWECK